MVKQVKSSETSGIYSGPLGIDKESQSNLFSTLDTPPPATLYTLRAGKTYAPATGITAMRVTLPAFPTSVFQPYEGVFRGGAIGRTKLVSKSSGSFFPLPWAWFDGNVRSNSNHVTIAYGRLILLFVASRSLVAQTAHGPSATQRLVGEYNAYTAMRTLQGTAIPTVMGMFTTKDGKNTVLMMSHAGKALRTFSDLKPSEKLMLFHRLVRLHKAGVQHNDLEPRNVKTAEMKTLEQETSTPPTVYSVVLAFVSAVVSALFGFSRRQRDV
ncbi:hypothetical protein B0H14DRAFT_2596036 [Mycena olivaceomarginata]|nr:hypothetical protein B0H14DRAFT_2596036 [Mycena olivaceomarginata]